jgi:hypothetical protein
MSEGGESVGFHKAPLSAKEALLFEAGVKLGGVFHQYVGMPVAPETAEGLARTIERAVRLQPFVTDVRVRIDPTRGPPAGEGRFGYQYLSPEMLSVVVTLHDQNTTVVASLDHRPELRYTLMSVLTAEEAPDDGELRQRRRAPRQD